MWPVELVPFGWLASTASSEAKTGTQADQLNQTTQEPGY